MGEKFEKHSMGYTGGDRAEFGIIDNIDPSKDYGGSYEPLKYNCIAICEEAIDDWYYELAELKTFWHCMDRPNLNIARFGVTLLPPASLGPMINVICEKTRAEFMKDALDVICVLEKAKEQNKFVILYDV